MDIDDRYLDVDFTKDPRYVFGALQDVKRKCRSATDAGVTIIPEDKWQELAELAEENNAGTEWLVTRIMDQEQEGSCVGNATAQIAEQTQASMLGIENVVPMSAISMYKQIGSSPGSGAMVDDALEKFKTVGMLPLDTPSNRARFGNHVMPHTGFYTPWPSGNWKATAAMFRADEFFVCEGEVELFSCLLQGIPVVVGREGHSIAYQTPRWKNGKWIFTYANSWSLNWGSPLGRMEGGFGFDTLSQFRKSAYWCFGVTSMVTNNLALAL